MLIFLMFSLVLEALFWRLCPLQLRDLAAPFHEACLAISARENLAPLSKLLLCNESNAGKLILAESKSTGTYYLVLFSSFHVLLIEDLLEMSTDKRAFATLAAWILNTFFLLIGGAPLRLLRSFLGLILRRCQKFWALNWTTVQIVTASGILLIPAALANREMMSLILGWTASLAAQCFASSTRFRKHIRIYLLLSPCLLPLALPHPTSTIVTFALGGILPWLTLPMALIEFACPLFHPVVSRLEQFLESFCTKASEVLPAPFAACSLPIWILLLYLAALTACAEWHRRHSERESAETSEPELLR